MKKINIPTQFEEGSFVPFYGSDDSAGADLKAFLPEAVEIPPLERVLIPTGLRMEIPRGYEGQIRPRSGFALKKGMTVLNSPGTIDSDYRGEIKVILINLSREPVIINNGDRIAQMIIAPVIQADFEKKEDLGNTLRGSGGFGSTGV